MWNATTAWCAALEGAVMPKEREREAPHVQLRRPGRSEGSTKSFLLFFFARQFLFQFHSLLLQKVPSPQRDPLSRFFFSRSVRSLSTPLSQKLQISKQEDRKRERLILQNVIDRPACFFFTRRFLGSGASALLGPFSSRGRPGRACAGAVQGTQGHSCLCRSSSSSRSEVN